VTTVTVFHNVSRDASFGLNAVWRKGPEAPEGKRAYQNQDGSWGWKERAETPAEQHELVRVFEYTADPDDVENDNVLNAAYETFNIGVGPVAQRYRSYRLRSLSVGDVLRVGDEYWSVEPLGFTRREDSELRVLTAAQARFVVRERYGPWGKNEPLSISPPLEKGPCSFYEPGQRGAYPSPLDQGRAERGRVTQAFVDEINRQYNPDWPSFGQVASVDCDGQPVREGERAMTNDRQAAPVSNSRTSTPGYDAYLDRKAAEQTLEDGYQAAERSYGAQYADYLREHDAEIADKGFELKPWPLSLQGNDGI
jgi:hypothetical protein